MNAPWGCESDSWIDAAQCAVQQATDVPTLDLLPPTYEESFLDLPPDYAATGAHATVHGAVDSKLDAEGTRQPRRTAPQQPFAHLNYDVKLDFTLREGIRSHANKKAKKAAKAAQKDKWADDDGENKEEGGEGDAGGEGGGGGGEDAGGGGGNGGGDGGGDPPGGGDGGGDDDDPWGAPTSKKDKKKKKKKNAW